MNEYSLQEGSMTAISAGRFLVLIHELEHFATQDDEDAEAIRSELPAHAAWLEGRADGFRFAASLVRDKVY